MDGINNTPDWSSGSARPYYGNDNSTVMQSLVPRDETQCVSLASVGPNALASKRSASALMFFAGSASINTINRPSCDWPSRLVFVSSIVIYTVTFTDNAFSCRSRAVGECVCLSVYGQWLMNWVLSGGSCSPCIGQVMRSWNIDQIAYLSRHIHLGESARTLRSSGIPLLDRPCTRTEFAKRAFRHSAPSAGNSLPVSVISHKWLTVSI